jgi:two-component system phosphate regulon response regulator OmpR
VAVILVVDDDPRICELLGTFFSDEGYETRRASDGLDALREIRRRRPDLIVTDLMLPRLDGAGLIDQVQRNGFQIPIIVISAVHDTARTLPVAGFVAKPFDLDLLADIVSQALADHA